MRATLVGATLLAATLPVHASAPASVPTPQEESVRVMNTVPRFRLRNQADEPFGAKKLEDKVWIATFIFTRCAATCPAQTRAMVELQQQLADHPEAADIHFVSISVDPEFDSPEVLREYAEGYGADLDNWSFLTGSKKDVRSLCEDGFRLPVEDASDSGPITHSPSFVLVDRARRVRGHYDARNPEALEALIEDLDPVLQDPPGPITANRREYFDDDSPGPVVHVPKEVRDTPWLKDAAEAQLATRDRFRVFHDFRFRDTQPESGITFVNRIVDDAARDYKAVHYDHGNGMAVADVDGDGLLDVYFVNQVGPSQLCRNLGNGKFEDVTEAAGVALADRIKVTASFADVDNDGDADLYVTSVRGGNVLFANDGNGHFEDVTKEAGIGYVGHCSSAVFFDYDRDGLLDLFLTVVGVYTTDEQGRDGYYVGLPDAFSGQLRPRRQRASVLFHNRGEAGFIDVTEETGLVESGWTGAATPVDIDADGWMDLYALNMQGHDAYWRNVEGKRFEDLTRKTFPVTPWGSMGVKAFDFDNDGLMDIFVTDMHTDMVDDMLKARRYWYADKMKMTDMYPKKVLATNGRHMRGNAFFVNQGKGRFRDLSDELGAENYWPWGLSTGDLNADGFEDAFVTASMNFPFRYAVNSLLLNDRGERFLDSEFIVGAEPRRNGTATPWFTLDCDGDDAEHGLCADREGRIEVMAALGSRSSAIFDIEGDGDLDIVTNEFNSAPMVLVSDLSDSLEDLRYLQVRLQGTESNRDGLGARVEVRAGDSTWTKYHDGQSGYMSQSSCPLYFGLGSADSIDSITVVWPSGREQVVEGPAETNRTVTIVEG